jgi:hypothetical protein
MQTTTGYLINRAAGRSRTRCAPCLQACGGQGTARPTIYEMSCSVVPLKFKIETRQKLPGCPCSYATSHRPYRLSPLKSA